VDRGGAWTHPHSLAAQQAPSTPEAFEPRPNLPGDAGGERLEVAITLLSGSRVATVTAYTEDSVATLKDQVAKVEGTMGWQQTLLLGSVELQEEQRLTSYGVSERGALELTLVRKATFCAASSFSGSRRGYVFKTGEQGLGYYIDQYEQRKLSARLVAA
jgi:hypothetical protein